MDTSDSEGLVAAIFLQNVCACVLHYAMSCLRTLCDLGGVLVQTFILFDSAIMYCIYTEIRSEFFPNLLCTKLDMLCTCTSLKIEGVK